MFVPVVLVLCVVLEFASSSAPVFDLPPWTPLNWTLLPPAAPDDTVHVVYLVAPLLEQEYGNKLGRLNAYHGALAFANVDTGFNVTINYDADDFFRASLFPIIVQYPNGTKDLVFKNHGASYVYYGINSTYWTKVNEVVAKINGTQYNQFMSGYNAATNASHQYYNLFSVRAGPKGAQYLPSWTCFDWVWSGFAALVADGVPISGDAAGALHATYTELYTGAAPVDVSRLYDEDTAEHARIVEFYEFIQLRLRTMSIVELVMQVVSLFEGNFYMRMDESIYKFSLHYPYVGVGFADRFLPA